MAGITLTTAQANLDAWVAASASTAQGKAYSIGSRSVTRADGEEILRMIDYWQRQVNRLTSGGRGGMRMRGGTPT